MFLKAKLLTLAAASTLIAGVVGQSVKPEVTCNEKGSQHDCERFIPDFCQHAGSATASLYTAAALNTRHIHL
ncbi:hypothetical protein H1R20_g438, partial [Candolleomyces eurysporus]